MGNDAVITKVTSFLNTFRVGNQSEIVNKSVLNELATNHIKNPTEFNIDETKNSIRKWFRNNIQYKEPFVWIKSGESEKFNLTDFCKFIRNDKEVVGLLGCKYSHFGITLSKKQNHYLIILILANMNPKEFIKTTIIQTYINSIDKLRKLSNCPKIEWSKSLQDLSLKQLKINVKNNNLSAQNVVENSIGKNVEKFKTGFIHKDGDLQAVKNYCSVWDNEDQFRNDALGDYDSFGISWVTNDRDFNIFYIFSKRMDKTKQIKPKIEENESEKAESMDEKVPEVNEENVPTIVQKPNEAIANDDNAIGIREPPKPIKISRSRKSIDATAFRSAENDIREMNKPTILAHPHENHTDVPKVETKRTTANAPKTPINSSRRLTQNHSRPTLLTSSGLRSSRSVSHVSRISGSRH